MGLLIDQQSKKVFEINSDFVGEKSLDESPLIFWYSQYLNLRSNFIEINPYNEYSSIILSSYCNNVYIYESNNIKTIEKIKNSAKLNNVSNINFVDNIAQLYKINNTSLIKINICSNFISVIESIKDILEQNSYPNLILDLNNEILPNSEKDISLISKCVIDLGYKFNTVAGVNNIYLASEHTKENSDIQELEEVIDMMAKGLHSQVFDRAKSLLTSNKYTGMIKATLLHNLTISSYYVPKIEEGRQFCEELILMPNIEYKMRNNCLMNLQFYIKPIEFVNKIQINIDDAKLNGFVETTPTILKFDGGYKTIIRTVNYKLDDNGNFLIRNNEQLRRTENYIIIYDNNWNILNVTKIKGNGRAVLFSNDFLGLEDIKLFKNNEFFCTSTEIHPSNVPQMCHGTIDNDGNVLTLNHIKVSNFINCEKNWLPFTINNDTYFIYKISPLRIYKLEENKITLVKSLEIQELDISGFRGSAPPIKYQNGLLFTIHQIYDAPLRKYYHRFVWINENFTILKFTDLFYFDIIGIEFNLGLGLCDDDKIAIGFSTNDSSAYIGIINTSSIIYTHEIILTE